MLIPKTNLLMAANLIVLLSSCLISISEASAIISDESTANYTGTEYLDSENKYLLSWEVSGAEGIIYFEVKAETKGFVGFGISPNGGMTGADILIAGVYPNGTIYSSDYHGVGNTKPVEDDHSDWIVTDAFETETHTTLKFHRLLDTCDNDDFKITDATMRLIWSLGDSDNVAYHGTNRGTKSVNFFMQDGEEFEPEKYEKLDLTVTMEMLAQDTAYWCTIHRAPIFNETQHIVAFDAILENAPALQHTHHFVVYRCVAPEDEDPEELFDKWVEHPGQHCFDFTSNNGFPFLQYCSRYSIYIWSKGGKRLVFPQNMGLPVPETPGRREYYAMEIHYDNPNEIQGLHFKTGARIYYTSELRETEVGLLLMNHNVAPQLMVPPMVTDYIVAGHCSSDCTEKFLPEDGITIFNNLFHAHLAGRKLKLRHFRGDKELPWVDIDEYYDFDFQQNKPLSNRRKVERGDQLTVECTYDSTTAEGGRAVIGGLSTVDEMCEATVYYYPRADIFYCGSMQNMTDHLNLLGMTNVTLKDSSVSSGVPAYEVLEPEHLAGDYRESASFKVNWTREFRERFQREKRYGEQLGNCNAGTQKLTTLVKYPDLEEYVPPSDCE